MNRDTRTSRVFGAPCSAAQAPSVVRSVSLQHTDPQQSSGCRLLAARLIKGRLCSVGGAFGAEEEPEAASVAAVVGSSKVGQTERCREIYI